MIETVAVHCIWDSTGTKEIFWAVREQETNSLTVKVLQSRNCVFQIRGLNAKWQHKLWGWTENSIQRCQRQRARYFVYNWRQKISKYWNIHSTKRLSRWILNMVLKHVHSDWKKLQDCEWQAKLLKWLRGKTRNEQVRNVEKDKLDPIDEIMRTRRLNVFGICSDETRGIQKKHFQPRSSRKAAHGTTTNILGDIYYWQNEEAWCTLRLSVQSTNLEKRLRPTQDGKRL